MICSSVNLFFTSNLLSYGIGLQSQALLKSGGTSEREHIPSPSPHNRAFHRRTAVLHIISVFSFNRQFQAGKFQTASPLRPSPQAYSQIDVVIHGQRGMVREFLLFLDMAGSRSSCHSWCCKLVVHCAKNLQIFLEKTHCCNPKKTRDKSFDNRLCLWTSLGKKLGVVELITERPQVGSGYSNVCLQTLIVPPKQRSGGGSTNTPDICLNPARLVPEVFRNTFGYQRIC